MAVDEASDTPEYERAIYGTGYAYFNLEDYDQALSWFRRFISRTGKKDRLLADACNRAGDCLFMNRTYYQAIDYYDRSIALHTDDAGYAMFQKGFSLGLVQRPAQKIEILNRLMKDFPKSQYVDDALFEIGRSYVDLNQSTDAVRTFKELIQRFPNSSYVRKSYVQLGLIYYNSNQNEEALAMYKKVVSTWPDTQESGDALNGIKNIYVEENRVDEYFDYARSAGKSVDISASEQDSLIYMSAENIYLQGNCDKARQNFDQYISKFPQGHFLLNAYYYKGDCHYKANELNEALSAYSFLLARGANAFTEVALARSAEITYQQSNFSRALVLYRQLEQQADAQENILDARIGMMRCSYRLKDYEAVIASARAVLGSSQTPDEITREASFILGKSYLEQGDQNKALEVLSGVAKDVKNKEGAEAKYLKADILFRQGKAEQAEKEILEFLELNTTHQYWLAKAYVLWSDIYLSRQDLFQAKATLQILKETYTGKADGIMETVTEKLSWIDSQTSEK
jgi:TolA-binding protein